MKIKNTSRTGWRRLLRIEPLEGRRVLTTFDLADLLPQNGGDGTAGFVVEQADGDLLFGKAVGDINGDGIADIAFGTTSASTFIGSYVVFGQVDGFAPQLEVSELDGTNGFRLFEDGALYLSINSAGDFNGDGINDLVIGNPHKTTDFVPFAVRNGTAYVVYGSSAGFPADMDLGNLNGINGFEMEGEDFHHGFFGAFVGGDGDFNGDGLSDLIISEPSIYSWGPLRLGLGTSVVQDPMVLSRTIVDQRFNSFDTHGLWSPSGDLSGDVNGDGFDDLLVGSGSSESFVVMGNANGELPYAPALLDGTNGSVIEQVTALRYAGDVNGDGFDEIIIGSGLIYGGPQGLAHPFDATQLDGNNGFEFTTGNFNFGGVRGAGDVNGDGLDDLLVAARGIDGRDQKVLLVLGRPGGFPASFDATNDNQVVVFESRADTAETFYRSGWSAGDINNDGLDDIQIGSGAENYVVFGQQFIADAGDFDGSFEFDGADLDLLQHHIVSGTGDLENFDLTGDGLIDVADRDQWLLIAGESHMGPGFAYQVGDANLDGVVDVSDFNIWNTNKFTTITDWTAGNFTADNVVDVSDFNSWNTNKFAYPAAEWTLENFAFGGRYLQEDAGQSLVLGTDVVQWDLTHTPSGLLLQNSATGNYMTSDDWTVGMQSNITPDSYWNLVRNLGGSFSLQTATTGRYLDGDGSNENWSVDLSLNILSDDKWNVVALPVGAPQGLATNRLAAFELPMPSERATRRSTIDLVFEELAETA